MPMSCSFNLWRIDLCGLIINNLDNTTTEIINIKIEWASNCNFERVKLWLKFSHNSYPKSMFNILSNDASSYLVWSSWNTLNQKRSASHLSPECVFQEILERVETLKLILLYWFVIKTKMQAENPCIMH